jgi:hypothetical protein
VVVVSTIEEEERQQREGGPRSSVICKRRSENVSQSLPACEASPTRFTVDNCGIDGWGRQLDLQLGFIVPLVVIRRRACGEEGAPGHRPKHPLHDEEINPAQCAKFSAASPSADEAHL